MAVKLNFPVDTFDQDNTFTFAFRGYKGRDARRDGYLLDCEEEGIYIMQRGACLKGQYTEKDREERARLNDMEPLRTGDTVEVRGKLYTVKILGDYSDAGRLIPV